MPWQSAFDFYMKVFPLFEMRRMRNQWMSEAQPDVPVQVTEFRLFARVQIHVLYHINSKVVRGSELAFSSLIFRTLSTPAC